MSSKTDSVTIQLKAILDDYENVVDEDAEKAFMDTAKEAVRQLRSTSPKRPGGGKYARSWTQKKEKTYGSIDTVIIHNAKHYQLTHLLENGHDIVRDGKRIGHVNPKEHIAPVERWAEKALPEAVKRELLK